MTETIVVVGAGIGGLSAAIRLAAAGKRVVVLEQNSNVGGKMSQIEADGFRWDTGPSVITMRPVLEDLFASASRSLEDYLTLLPVSPLTRYFYPDGTVLDASADPQVMADQIERIEPADVVGYRDYLDYAAKLHRITGPVFIYSRPPTWRSFLRVKPWEALQVDVWRTMDDKIRQFVKSPHMRQLLGRFATYAGSSPYKASTTLNVIADVELNGGVWYPKGGVFVLAEALARLATELGVVIRPSCGVQQILHEKGTSPRAVGVLLDNGERLPAAAVVANVDVTTVYQRLLADPVSLRRGRQLASMEPSCSGLVMLLGVEGDYPQLAHHNIFFSTNYPAEFSAIFDEGVPPAEPTIYVAITSKTDPDHAPSGHENWFILVNAPAQPAVDGQAIPAGRAFDWSKRSQTYRELVLRRLAAFDCDIRDRIRVQHTLTPVDLAHNTGAWRGALYGMSLNSLWAPFKRPANRALDIQGLYFVGGTTHPGGGVPLVMLSAKVATSMMTEDGLI